ncbi:hypothetical protein WEI85_11445 [Actinomycetes bacterium KLBMP 9797]
MTGPTPLPRPTLLPGLHRVWRDRHTLQLGLDPAHAVLLEVANPAAARLLDLLDGAHSERTVLEHANRLGVAREEARQLLDALRAAGLVVGAHSLLPTSLPEPVRRRLTPEAAALGLRRDDAPGTPAQVLRRRAVARVVITGHSRLAAPLAVALAQAGVGHVYPDLAGQVAVADTVGGPLDSSDVRRPRGAAVVEAVTRAAPGVETRPVRRGRPSLVVQTGSDRPAALMAAGFAQRRQAHLAIGVRDGTAIIGPLVPPGGAPCLNCLELHRIDRDPAWPAIAAQLAGDGVPEVCGTSTVLAAVAYATAEVLSFLDGESPDTLGAAVEITAPGRTRRRAWPPHPACDCARRK